MVELFLIYVFAAGYILGQLAANQRPHGVGTPIWSLAIITATILWPIFVIVSIIVAIIRAIIRNRTKRRSL